MSALDKWVMWGADRPHQDLIDVDDERHSSPLVGGVVELYN